MLASPTIKESRRTTEEGGKIWSLVYSFFGDIDAHWGEIRLSGCVYLLFICCSWLFQESSFLRELLKIPTLDLVIVILLFLPYRLRTCLLPQPSIVSVCMCTSYVIIFCWDWHSQKGIEFNNVGSYCGSAPHPTENWFEFCPYPCH